MPLPAGVDFEELRLEGCCGMVELSGISRHSSRITWGTVGKRLTDWLDTHGNRDDNPEEVYSYEKNKYVPRTKAKQDWSYGRRMVITSIKKGQKELIEGLVAAGWKHLNDFPGNHGNYKLALLGYVPKSPNNKDFHAGKMADDDGSSGENDEDGYDDDY